MNFKKVLGVAALVVVSTSFTNAQSSNPAWLDSLHFQMERDKQCEVAYYIRTDEKELGAQRVYEARVQCVDGRQFDATRIGEDDEFDIRTCEIETC